MSRALSLKSWSLKIGGGGGFPETGDRGIGSGVGRDMDKGGSLDWATFHPLPLTPGKTLVILPSKVTSQGDPPTPALLGRTDCHLSKGSHNYAVYLCIPEPRSVLNTLESLRKWYIISLTRGIENSPTQKQRAER